MTTDKIQRGIAAYIDSEIIPNIKEGMVIGSGKLSLEIPASLKRALVGTAGAVLSKKAAALATEYLEPDGNGEFDLEAIKDIFIARMGDQPMPIKIGNILEMNLTKNDVNDLYRYILNA
jgi:hypothetical protein